MPDKLKNKNIKINIAIIGCGRISKKHISAMIQEYKRCNLIAICDNNKERINDIYDFYRKELEKNNIAFKSLNKYK